MLIKTTSDQAIRAIFDSISHESLPHADREWLLRLSFQPAIERAFLHYYKLRIQRWMILASSIIGGFIALPIAIRQFFFYGNTTSNSTDMTASLFLAIVLIVLVLRIRVRYSLPLLSVTSLILFGYTGVYIHAVSLDTSLQTLMVTAFAGLMSLLFEYDARHDFLSHAHMYRVATTDSLSQVLNRYALFERGALEVARTQRYGGHLSVLMVDVDRFKEINDRYGHPVGDQVIAALGATYRHHLRTPDLVGRIGGEEFAILLPDTDIVAAVHVAERLRMQVAADVVSAEVQELRLTVSIGVATFGEGDHLLQDVITRADACLYEAKRKGRNCVISDPLLDSQPLTARTVGAV